MQIVMPTAEELQQKLDHANHQLELIKTITTELLTELDLGRLLDRVARVALELIDAETLVIPLINESRDSYTYRGAAGKNASEVYLQTIPVTVGMCGWVLSHQKPLLFGRDIPWLMDEKTRWEEGMESALLVPLIARGEIIGGLSGLGKKGGGSFTTNDFELMEIFAAQVSIAIDNARIIEELSAEKEQSEITLNSIGDAVVTTDTRGIIQRVNPVASNLLGWSKEELIGRPLSDVFLIHNAHTGQPVGDPVKKVMETGEIVGLANNTMLIGRDGSQYLISDSAAPIRNESGQLQGVVLVFSDVTEEYGLISELRKSEQKHRRLIEHLGSEFFMFLQNVDGELDYVSPSIRECMGYSPQEFIQKNPFSQASEESRRVSDVSLEQAQQGINPMPYEIEVPDRQGERCYLRVTKTPVLDSSGKLVAIEGLVQNITQLKSLEEAARQSQKMEAIGQLSGGIAHDFNNQLGVVLGYLDMLLESTEESAPEYRWIDTAIKATQRCIELTRSLMNFSRKKMLSKSVISLDEVILSMRPMLEDTLMAAIQLKIQPGADLMHVVADEGEFHDVLLNLLINARDAMPAGGEVVIRTQSVVLDEVRHYFLNRLEPGRYVKLSVQDTGNGMSREVMERIFEPFFTTKAPGAGTGLGMPMVFGFINRVNGAIDVVSTPGQGTVFDLYLPQVRQSSSLAGNAFRPESEPPGGCETILVVEDEPGLRGLACDYLSSAGYKVRVAEDAHQALSLLAEDESIELMFTDIVMPGGMNGFDLMHEARALRPGLDVLLATGYTSHRDIDKSRLKEAMEILYKPYSRAILLQRIRRILDYRDLEMQGTP